MDHEEARRRLMEERLRLEKEVEVFEDELGESLEDASEESIYDQHMAETAAVTLDREIDLTLEENARAALEKIDRALTKLDEGSYGVCDSCKGPSPRIVCARRHRRICASTASVVRSGGAEHRTTPRPSGSWPRLRLRLRSALDLLSKRIVQSTMVLGQPGIPGDEYRLLPFLTLQRASNQGVAFGLLSGRYSVIVPAACLALVLVFVYLALEPRPLIGGYCRGDADRGESGQSLGTGDPRARHRLPAPPALSDVQPGRYLHRGRCGPGGHQSPLGWDRVTRGRGRTQRLSAWVEYVAGPEDDGLRVDSFLGSRPEVGSRSQAAALAEAGAVTVDGVPRLKSHKVSPGQRVVVHLAGIRGRSCLSPRTWRSRSSTRTIICSWWTSRPAWWCIPLPATPRARW